MLGQVAAVGSGVEGIHEGDHFALRAPHQEYVTVPTRELYPVPDGICDEDAAWLALASIVQNGVRRAEHTLGDAVVVIGLGLLGQLVVQYVHLLGVRLRSIRIYSFPPMAILCGSWVSEARS